MYVRHNNNAGSSVVGIPVISYWPELSQLEMKLQYAWNQRTYHFLIQNIRMLKIYGDIYVCINKSKDSPTDMLERTTSPY